jgi:hypothetical protein
LPDSVADCHSPCFQVNSFDIPIQNRCASKQSAKRIADVCRLKIAGYHLMEHGAKESEVISADESHFDIRLPGCSLI